MRSLISILSLTLLLNSCKSEPPISKDKFIKVYTSMVIMQDTSSLNSKQLKDSVLSVYGISDEEYNKTIDYYNNEPERWQLFFTKAEAYLDSMKNVKVNSEP